MARILCVEDESDIRRDIADELTDAGHEVIARGSGTEGLKAILEHEPDLVVCDCLMPEMTGGELLTVVRRDHPDLHDLPWVFLSAHADKRQIEQGFGLGAQAYLTKPVDFDKLITTIKALLQARAGG